VGIRLAERTLQRVTRRIRQLTRRHGGQAIEQVIDRLNRFIPGWVNYFALADAQAHMRRLDEYLRRRLRQILWKQWKTSANRYRNLRSRGVSEFWAIRTGGTSKGCWCLSASPPLQQALNNAYWVQLGLKTFSQQYQLRHT
jgi:RNA-directed DNA polymerase